jgi:hypothetical protein
MARIHGTLPARIPAVAQMANPAAASSQPARLQIGAAARHHCNQAESSVKFTKGKQSRATDVRAPQSEDSSAL